MHPSDRAIIESVLLKRITSEKWREFLNSGAGKEFSNRIRLVRATVKEAGIDLSAVPRKPVAEAIDIYGARLLAADGIGQWLRRALLESMPARHWAKLRDQYRELAGLGAESVHGNMIQSGAGSRVMSEYWHQGGHWARAFCLETGLPECLSMREGRSLPADDEIWPAEPLPALHDFQVEVYEQIKMLLAARTGSAMLSLPTGAGKTRVTVEAICDHIAGRASGLRDVVLWIAQSEELQMQAWQTFRDVWQVPPKRLDATVQRVGMLRLLCAWGGRDPESLVLDSEKTVIVAGIQQLHSWVQRSPDVLEQIFPRNRRLVVIVDEAHRLIAEQHREVLIALGLRLKGSWRLPQNSAPVIGLSATPWRTEKGQDESLRTYFQATLLTPGQFGGKPISTLQSRGILSNVTQEALLVKGTPQMSEKQQRDFETFHELPQDYLAVLGRDVARNAAIIKRLRVLERNSKVLVFACSVEHAELLTLLINRALGPCAAVVTAKTSRSQRAATIEDFRTGGLRFLCNVGVLTTGFDAPKANVVCMTRPTWSASAYEQMVGRGLRGPKNGGTKNCLVIDVQDVGLPNNVQSYARVVDLWDRESKGKG
jgi:DNA repair protein RadD